MSTKISRLAITAVLVALGTATASTVWFPAGVARAYPMQHAINVLAAVHLGPAGAVLVAFIVGLIRNLLGLGTLLAFPGGMIGALLAGLGYRLSGNRPAAAFGGEVLGTGILGALVSVPVARYILGQEVAALFFIPSFITSSILGAALGLGLALALNRAGIRAHNMVTKSGGSSKKRW